MNRVRAELFLSRFVLLVRAFAGPQRPIEVCFEHEAPSYASEYRRYFGNDVRFAQPRAGIRFARALLDLPQYHWDPRLYRLLRDQASQLLAEVPNQSVARRVRLLLLQSPQPRLELRDVARRLGTSDRTLRRQLAAEGTSFREILDSAMRERTLSLLRDRALSLEEVTERAGFIDPVVCTAPFDAGPISRRSSFAIACVSRRSRLPTPQLRCAGRADGRPTQVGPVRRGERQDLGCSRSLAASWGRAERQQAYERADPSSRLRSAFADVFDDRVCRGGFRYKSRMNRPVQIGVPSLVRIKPGALGRVGVYLERMQVSRAVLLVSEGLPSAIVDAVRVSLAQAGIRLLQTVSVIEASYEAATSLVPHLPAPCHAILGLGGGRALDVAKYVAHLAMLPYLAVPSSLSNDGFASPTASLTVDRRRRSFGCALPRGVVVDTEVCHGAPESLWFSGIGDVAAKVTAVADWKLAFHARAEPVDDLAALLSDATVFQLAARPVRDLDGERLLATALLLDGVAMEMAGSSRPASGSEHLISHALDFVSERPRLHGLQVGMAAYLVGALQRDSRTPLEQLLVLSGFFDEIRRDPFSRTEWLQAIAMAPSMKDDFHTVLSERPDALDKISNAMMSDPQLAGCFVA